MTKVEWSAQLALPATHTCNRTKCATRCGSGSYADRHPNRARRSIDAIVNGADIGFTGNRAVSRPAPNLQSATANETVERMVTAIIEADARAGTKAGPFDAIPPGFEHFSYSPIGAVQKGGTWEKIRVIHHLSYPFGGDSINNSISDDELSLGSFDQACAAIRTLGVGCWLIKLDVEAAYKQVPVRQADRALLGLKWRGKYYYELALPFGLKSSGARWELFAAALHWFFQHHLGITLVIHYVDDFLFVVPTEADGCALLALALALCSRLGVPMSEKKTEGPTQCLTFLGIEINTVTMRARLSDTRLSELTALLQSWKGRTDCTLKELQSLVGKLSFATKVVRPGRAYHGRLRAAMRAMRANCADEAARTVRHALTPDLRADIRWWRMFMAKWNGHSLIYEQEWTDSIQLQLHTDACDTGYGAVYGNHWFQGIWTAAQLARAWRVNRHSMPYLEMHALVQAALTWGHEWGGKKVVFLCDCQPVCFGINSLYSKDSDMQGLLRTLSHTAGSHGFDFRARHIPGETNVIADALSRGCTYQELVALSSMADVEPTPAATMPRHDHM